jgi:hypothetical protein
LRDAGHATRSRDPEGGSAKGEARREAQVDEAQARELAELEQIAGHSGENVRQARAEIGNRPGEPHLGPMPDRPIDALRNLGAGQGGRGGWLKLLNALDARGVGLAQLGGLAGHTDEGAGDCSPAMGSAASRNGNAVSIR